MKQTKEKQCKEENNADKQYSQDLCLSKPYKSDHLARREKKHKKRGEESITNTEKGHYNEPIKH